MALEIKISEVLRKMKEEGKTVKEVAAEYGVPFSSLKKALADAGFSSLRAPKVAFRLVVDVPAPSTAATAEPAAEIAAAATGEPVTDIAAPVEEPVAQSGDEALATAQY